ncbi:hypothetical protein [Klenkia soli]|uniref:hypothetical protein n=1 Tax=Klenkia soli TaxID=1052260 RepID=UPI0013F4C3DA|nr:hypothetical protein [Klenkia soli]
MAPAVVNAWWVQLAAVIAMTVGTAWLMDLTMRAFSGELRRPRRRRRGRRRPGRGTARRPVPVAEPQRRSVQVIAADLRRLRRELALVPTGSAAHRAGVLAAYEDVLVEAADSLEVPHRLRQACAGEERELERLRLAAALADTGLVISDPQDRG